MSGAEGASDVKKPGRLARPGSVEHANRPLGGFRQRPEATSADVQAIPIALHEYALLLHVRLERAALLGCFALPATTVLVPNMPAKHCSLAANVAGSTCHAFWFLT